MFQSYFKSPFQSSRNNVLVSSREQLSGSRNNLSGAFAVTPNNILDPMKLMSMRDATNSKMITSEVMKQSLYESVVSSSNRLAGKRRYSIASNVRRRPQSFYPSTPKNEPEIKYNSSATSSVVCGEDLKECWRNVQSMPVSPCLSPRSSKRFCSSLVGENDLDQPIISHRKLNLSRTSLLLASQKEIVNSGLAAILQPRCSRFVSASKLEESTPVSEVLSNQFTPSNSGDVLADVDISECSDSKHTSCPSSSISSTLSKSRNGNFWNTEIGMNWNSESNRLEPISSGSSIAQSINTGEERQSMLSLLAANIENDADVGEDSTGDGSGRIEFLKPKNKIEEEESMDD